SRSTSRREGRAYRADSVQQAYGAKDEIEDAVEDEESGQNAGVFAAELEEGREEGVGLAATQQQDAVEEEDDMQDAGVDGNQLGTLLQAQVARVEGETGRPTVGQHGCSGIGLGRCRQSIDRAGLMDSLATLTGPSRVTDR